MWPFIGPFPTYGILYLTAYLVHYLVSWRIAKRYSLEWRVWLTASVLFSVGSIVGGKLLHDLLFFEWSWPALFRVKHYLYGGYWGGMLGYLGLAVPAVWWLSKRKREALDLVALSIPIPFMLAKLGCFLHGCCYGRWCSLPWAVVYPPGSRGAPAGIPLHPTQIYEMLGMLAVLLVFRRMDTQRWRGTMLLWFLAVNGASRVICELFRGDLDPPLQYGPVTLSQLLCLGGVAVSGVLLMGWARRNPHHGFIMASQQVPQVTVSDNTFIPPDAYKSLLPSDADRWSPLPFRHTVRCLLGACGIIVMAGAMSFYQGRHQFPSWFFPVFLVCLVCFIGLIGFHIGLIHHVPASEIPRTGPVAIGIWAMAILSVVCTSALHGFSPFQWDVFDEWRQLPEFLRFIKYNFILTVGSLAAVAILGAADYLGYRRWAATGLLFVAGVMLIPNDDCPNGFNQAWIDWLGASPMMFLGNSVVLLVGYCGLHGVWPRYAVALMASVNMGVLLLGLGHITGFVW